MTSDVRPVTRLTASLRICAVLTNIAFAVSAQAAEFSARDISRLLFQTAPGSHPALDGKNLRRLDLSHFDFNKSTLSKTDFFGADLSGADLSSTNLSGAILDRVTLVGARLCGAHLLSASLHRPSAYSAV